MFAAPSTLRSVMIFDSLALPRFGSQLAKQLNFWVIGKISGSDEAAGGSQWGQSTFS